MINPYLDLPLPVGVRLDLAFGPEAVDPDRAVRTVVRALNAYAYTEDRTEQSAAPPASVVRRA